MFDLQWVNLEEAKTGMIHLRLTWLQLTSNKEDLKLVSNFRYMHVLQE